MKKILIFINILFIWQGVYADNKPILRLETGMHTARINRIGVDAAERFLLTGSEDKTVRLWSLPEGQLLRTFRPPIGKGNEGKIYAVAISPDGKTIAAGGWTNYSQNKETFIYLFDRTTGELTQRITGHLSVINHLTYSSNSHYLAASLGEGKGIRIYRSSNYDLVTKDTDYENNSLWVEFDNTGRLVTSCLDGYIRLYDKNFNLLTKRKAPGGNEPSAVRFSPTGDKIAVGFNDSTQVNVLSGKNLKLLYSPNTQDINNGSLFSVAWSQDGYTLYAGGRYEENGKAHILRWSRAGKGYRQAWAASANTIMDIRTLTTGSVVFGAGDPVFGIFTAQDEKTLYREAGIADFRDNQYGFLISKFGNKIQFGFEVWGKRPANFSVAERILKLNLASNLIKSNTSLNITNLLDFFLLNGIIYYLEQGEIARSLAITPDGQYLLLGADWSLRLLYKQGYQLWQIPTPSITWGVNITENGKVAIASFGDGTIRWYRLTDGQELLAFFPHKDRKRWVIWTPQGYYDASVGGEELIGWHVNNGPDKAADFYDVGQFRDIYYRPDVISKVLDTLDPQEALRLANQAMEIKPTPTTISQVLPPVIELLPPENSYFSTSELKLKYKVRKPSGEPIKTVKVMLNGRPYPNENISRLKQKDFQENKIYTFTLHELPQEDINISLLAENRYTTSQPSMLSLTWKQISERGRPSSVENLEQTRQHNLYVLAIGVSKYDDNSVSTLTYPAQDAEDFKELIEKQKGKGLYDKIKVQFLPNATKQQIFDGLNWLENTRMTPDDTSILFLAGHGFNYKREYYFLPKDGNSRKLHGTSLPYYELKRTMSLLPGKVLFFIDSCHAGGVSGGSLQMVDMNYISNDLSSDSKGVVVFAASTGKQTSMEASDWKNGAFTEALLEGLTSKTISKNGQISQLHLGTYISDRVPELVKKVKPSHQQTPTYYSPGAIGKFPIVCTETYCSR
jgi:WD40 repeat protein